jgi:HNH endonuclease
MPRIHISAELRRLVIERAQECCEYCLLHQDNTGVSHQVDHVIALKHSGQTVRENLALACLECNLNKGSDLTTIDPATGEIIPLFNPRQQVWREHFTLAGAMIAGLTQTGRVTIALLQINSPDRIAERQELMELNLYPPEWIRPGDAGTN